MSENNEQTKLEKAKDLWEKFESISVNEAEEIEEDFLGFGVGTHRSYVRSWLEETYDISALKEIGTTNESR